MAEAPAARFVTTFEDSRRWRHVVRRSGDIIISTPPKSGTTLTQGIVSSLLWPAGDAPGTRGTRSPWVDMRMTPINDLVESLESMQHRRYLKTHSPGDCIPFDKDCCYIVVYRDGRDSLVSWGNHRSKMRAEVVAAINAVASQSGVAPLPTTWDGDYDVLFDEWEQVGSPVRHLASWWPRRHEPNVLFVHYADLAVDLESEMRRIAEHLTVSFDESLWPQVVARCSLGSMRDEADAQGGLDRMFNGGASSFFNQGINGRWREILSQPQLERYADLVSNGLPADAASWLENGSLAMGARPNEVGAPQSTTLATGGGHPVFGRLARQQTNSLAAIADRRVADARDEGLFDDLALHGKPIPDIDRHRPPGWWANRFVAKERNKVRAMQIEDELRSAMPGLWRLETEDLVREEVQRLNTTIDEYNRVTTLAPQPALDLSETLQTWRDLKNR